jgi:hypothetical protein
VKRAGGSCQAKLHEYQATVRQTENQKQTRQSIQTRNPNTGSGLARQTVGGGSLPGDNRDGKAMERKLRRYNVEQLGEIPLEWDNGTMRILVCQMGGVCQCRSKGDKDSIHRKTDTKI